MYKPVIVRRGSGGWGGPLTLVPTEEKHKIVSITGGGIHPLAVKIADMCGGEAVDGFSHAIPESEILAVVIDCGGTARCGDYQCPSCRKIRSIGTIHDTGTVCIGCQGNKSGLCR